MNKSFKVTQIRSSIGCSHTQRSTLEAIKLGKRGKSVVLMDNNANRGQILKIQHLVEVKVQVES